MTQDFDEGRYHHIRLNPKDTARSARPQDILIPRELATRRIQMLVRTLKDGSLAENIDHMPDWQSNGAVNDTPKLPGKDVRGALAVFYPPETIDKNKGFSPHD